MLARFDPFAEQGDLDGKQVGLMKQVSKQFPQLFPRMIPSASEARRHNRNFGIRPGPGQTHQDMGVMNVTSEMHEAICVLAGKLTKAIYYMETSEIFPSFGCLTMNWFTNADLIREGKYPIFDLLKDINGKTPPLVRSRNELNDQFEYKFSLDEAGKLLMLQARFGSSFGFVVFGSTVAGKLEGIYERIAHDVKARSPFAVLQSSKPIATY